MLNIDKVKIEVQSFGTVWAVFLSGAKEDIELRFNSFWNWKGICGNSAELEWWHDGMASFWSYPKNFAYAMEMAALAEILNSENTKGTNPLPRAVEIAEQRMGLIEKVTVIKNNDKIAQDVFGMGTSISAERSSGNFNDLVAETITSFRD